MGGGSQALALVATTAVVFAGAALIDFCLDAEPTLRGALAAACLGIGLGAVLGGVLAVATEMCGRLRPLARTLVWLCVGAGFAAWLGHELGVTERISGRYASLAAATLTALGLGALLFGLAGRELCVVDGRRLLQQRSWLVRRSLAALGVIAAVAQLAIEREWLAGPYPTARLALRVGTLGAILFTLCAADPPQRVPGRRSLAVAAAAVALLAALPLGLVRPDSFHVSAALAARPYSELVLRAYQSALDFDGDGYSTLLAGGDCDDGDPRRSPGHREVAGNGRDENCRGGDGRFLSAALSLDDLPWSAAPPPVSVVLITVDTLSAEHVSGLGYSRPTTPNLDRWAKEQAVTFSNAYAPSTSTQYSLSGLMRGVYARRLRWSVVPKEFGSITGTRRLRVAMPIRERRPALASFFARRGMLTVAFTDDGDSSYLDSRHNIAGRFDEWTSARTITPTTDDRALSEAVLRELETIDAGRRFFLWVHYFGPHTPTVFHPGVPRFGSSQRDEYDHEIAAFDRGLAPLLDELTRRKAAGEPLVVALTGDHGEDLFYQRTHGLSLSESTIHVPLYLSAPDLRPREVRALVSTLDLFPTLLRYTGSPVPAQIDGVDLARSLGDPPPGAQRRIVLSEGWLYSRSGERYADQIVATDMRHRLVKGISSMSVKLESVTEARKSGRPPNLIEQLSRPELDAAIDDYLDVVEPPEIAGSE